MFYKTQVLLCSVVACVIAAPTNTDVVPLEKQQPTVIPIVSQSEEIEANGTFKYSYETANGIKREETSYNKVLPKAEGRSAGSGEGSDSSESNEIYVQQGSYSYVAPDGTIISVKYIADENGFRPIGDHLPKAPSAVNQAQTSPSGNKSGRALSPENKKSSPAPAAAVQDDKIDNAPENSVAASSTPKSEVNTPEIAARSGISTDNSQDATTISQDTTTSSQDSTSAAQDSTTVSQDLTTSQDSSTTVSEDSSTISSTNDSSTSDDNSVSTTVSGDQTTEVTSTAAAENIADSSTTVSTETVASDATTNNESQTTVSEGKTSTESISTVADNTSASEVPTTGDVSTTSAA